MNMPYWLEWTEGELRQQVTPKANNLPAACLARDARALRAGATRDGGLAQDWSPTAQLRSRGAL